MAENEKQKSSAEQTSQTNDKHTLSETWAQDALQDLEDWIEEQGIYLRQ